MNLAASTTIGTLGVLCNNSSGDPPFTEAFFCKNLSLSAPKYGLKVIVLRPKDLIGAHPFVTGYVYEENTWKQKVFPAPDILYNRCISVTGLPSLSRGHHSQIKSHFWTAWSRALPGKWRVYQMLRKDNTLEPFLPPTRRYTGIPSLEQALEAFEHQVFLKPSGGCQGRSTLRVTLQKGVLTVHGRSTANEPFQHVFRECTKGMRWIHAFIKERTFLIQPFLHLYSIDEKPFDVRVLMQKNEHGNWMRTGSALRQGAAGGITSNLHGGGTAAQVLPFLQKEYGKEAAHQIETTINRLSMHISVHLEQHFGRLGELGIDFGIDREGNPWLLEVNSKPGRASFKQSGDLQSASLATENPLRYARYLLLRQLRRVNP